MVEFPTELALKTNRLLFKNDLEVLQKAPLLRNQQLLALAVLSSQDWKVEDEAADV